jgi:hypothetical protein
VVQEVFAPEGQVEGERYQRRQAGQPRW